MKASELKLGDTLAVKVVQVDAAFNAAIVSIDGSLLRVVNHTGSQLKAGQWIEVEVEAVSPLAFRIPSQARLQGRSLERRI